MESTEVIKPTRVGVGLDDIVCALICMRPLAASPALHLHSSKQKEQAEARQGTRTGHPRSRSTKQPVQ